MAEKADKAKIFTIFFSIFLLCESLISLSSDTFSSLLEKHGYSFSSSIFWLIGFLGVSLTSFLLFLCFLILTFYWKNRGCKKLTVLACFFMSLYFVKMVAFFCVAATYLLGLKTMLEFFNSIATGFGLYATEISLYILTASFFFFKFVKRTISDYFYLVLAWIVFLLYILFLKFINLWAKSLLLMDFFLVLVVNLNGDFLFNLFHYVPVILSFLVIVNHEKELQGYCF